MSALGFLEMFLCQVRKLRQSVEVKLLAAVEVIGTQSRLAAAFKKRPLFK